MNQTCTRAGLRGMALASAFALACCVPLYAQSANPVSDSNESPESFRIELQGAGWLVNTSGYIQSRGTPVNLISDLGAYQNQGTFWGQLVVKPGRKHRVVFEGTPFRINGYNTVNRSVTYAGQTFQVSETLQSSADVNYFFGGYQYDVLTGQRGHLGFSVGAAYLGGTGTIQAVQASTTASKSETVGLPLAGVDARLFPIPGHRLIEIEGGLRGMDVGSYGHYLEGTVNGGLCLGHLAVLAGYRQVNALFQDTNNSSGINVQFKGPIFTGLWRW